MAFEVVEMALYRHPVHLRRLGVIRRRVTRELAPLTVTVATSPEPVPFDRRMELAFRPARPGTRWGTAYTCAWFHVTGQVPAGTWSRAANGGPPVVLVLDVDGESLVRNRHGDVVGALSSRVTPVEAVATTRGKTRLALTPELAPDGVIDLWLDAGFNGKLMPPLGWARVRRTVMATWDDELAAVHDDYLAVAYALAVPGPDRARRRRISTALDEAWRTLQRFSPADVERARQILRPLLGGPADPGLTVTAVGHGHLDLAWLWPLRETRRKAVRTLTHQVQLLDEYPGHVYGVSQPQQLAWVEHDAPSLFERVQQAVADGHIEVQGGMWVEPDTNLPSGESLVRQVVLGQQYWQSRFGRTATYCWLPDVFGYSANLPQILRQGGMEALVTIKLAWNEHNNFPHRSFTWEGIDGSTVLVHMPPEGTYNSSATPAALGALRAQYPPAEAETAGEALLVYGSGDGGGGPGPAHFAMLDRVRHFDGLPAVRPGTVAGFLGRLARRATRLPRYRGELYLEKHQGTYTTQSELKRCNRHLEHVLHDTEYLAVLALAGTGGSWPGEVLERSWERVLLHQFHDILPGSSVTRVNTEALATYAEVEADLLAVQRAALAGGDAGTGPRTSDPYLVNTRSVTRRGYTEVGGRWYRYQAPPFTTVALEPWSAASTSTAAPPVADRAEVGAGAEDGGAGGAGPVVVAEPALLANDRLRAEFGPDGSVVSLVDLTSGREVSAGYLNRLVLYRDRWSYFDAWDIDFSYRSRPTRTLIPETVETFVDGPRAVRRATYRHGRTLIVQDAVLTPGQPYLSFETTVEWHERWHMLRAEFAPSAWADEVACEIQFGHWHRSTRNDTPEERAQFEICAHRWIDLTVGEGEEAHGFSLLNRAKYGHHVKDGVVSLALLRAPVYPDPRADRGTQQFSYAVYPHEGGLRQAATMALAEDYNAPLVITDRPPTGLLAPGRQLFTVERTGGDGAVVLETVTRTAGGTGVLVRLYESHGRPATIRLTSALEVSGARETDLLERSQVAGTDLSALSFTPFEVKTLCLDLDLDLDVDLDLDRTGEPEGNPRA